MQPLLHVNEIYGKIREVLGVAPELFMDRRKRLSMFNATIQYSICKDKRLVLPLNNNDQENHLCHPATIFPPFVKCFLQSPYFCSQFQNPAKNFLRIWPTLVK